MAEPLKDMPHKLVSSTISVLSDAGMTSDHANWLRKPYNAGLLIEFMDEQMRPAKKIPFEKSVEVKLAALRLANSEEGWGIEEADFARLAESVPGVPKGENVYLSFRIRWGEGSEGVQLTFERHVARIKSVFGEGGFWRWEHLHSGKDRLRLLNGDHTHKPVIEWVIVDLGTHRKHDSITAVRGVKSLADELLVMAWLFPDMIRAIDPDKLSGLFAAGYESNVPEHDGGGWQEVVLVRFDRDDRQVRVIAYDRSSDSSDYSVPVLRE